MLFKTIKCIIICDSSNRGLIQLVWHQIKRTLHKLLLLAPLLPTRYANGEQVPESGETGGNCNQEKGTAEKH
jgi:hypothetical protein